MTLRDLPVLHEPPAVTAAQMAEVDRAALAEHGIALETLMENASGGIALAARACLGGAADRRIVALAGPGNNGGDALGAARYLQEDGARVRAFVTATRDRLRDVPALEHDRLAAQGVAISTRIDETALASADLVVDGLLGYSVSGPPHGAVEAFIEDANACGRPVLAIDLPSGMHPDTGAPLGACIRATYTVTLALPKTGLLAPAARELVGLLLLTDIGIPPSAYERFGIDARRVFREGPLVRVEP